MPGLPSGVAPKRRLPSSVTLLGQDPGLTVAGIRCGRAFPSPGPC